MAQENEGPEMPEEVKKVLEGLKGLKGVKGLEGLQDILEGLPGDEEEAGAEAEMLLAVFTDGYKELLAEAKPFLDAAPGLAHKAGTDFAPVIVTLLAALNAVVSDAAFVGEAHDFRINKAAAQADMLKVYVNAGFTRAEAFQLVLQSMQKRPLPRPPLNLPKGGKKS